MPPLRLRLYYRNIPLNSDIQLCLLFSRVLFFFFLVYGFFSRLEWVLTLEYRVGFYLWTILIFSRLHLKNEVSNVMECLYLIFIFMSSYMIFIYFIFFFTTKKIILIKKAQSNIITPHHLNLFPTFYINQFFFLFFISLSNEI